jgi:hypothetical protein
MGKLRYIRNPVAARVDHHRYPDAGNECQGIERGFKDTPDVHLLPFSRCDSIR